jgi:hypothetical protein
VDDSVPKSDWVKLLCAGDAREHDLFRRRSAVYLAQIKRFVEARGARLGVLIIHYQSVFPDEPSYRDQKPTCRPGSGEQYNAFIESTLRAADIQYWNTYDALVRAKTARPKRKLWHFHDYHWSPAGHRVVADELLAFWRRLAGQEGS